MKRLPGILFLLFFAINLSVAQEDLKIIHGPYIQNVSETGATVIFMTNALVVSGVMIRSGNKEFELIQNSDDGLFNVGSNIHKVKINNLVPGTLYEYKLFACEIIDYKPYRCELGDTIISDTFKFKTFEAGKKKINFTVFCDIHDRSEKLGKYLDSNDIQNQDCYFLNGDIMGHIEEENQIFTSFLDTCVDRFASEIPFFYVRGNHETRGKFARELKNYLDLPDGRYYYAFNLGPVRFIVLDGGEDKPDDNVEYSGLVDFDKYRQEELSWLKKEVKSDEFNNAIYKVVIIHMPILKHEKSWHGMAFLAEYFGPVLQETGIDLMISGHTHRNAWIEAKDSGFGYPILISSNNNFIEASVNEQEISLILKDLNGEIETQYLVDKD